MNLQQWNRSVICMLGLLVVTSQADARDGRFDIGIRFNALGATGEPTNDILGFGINARYKLSDRWWVGFGVDQSDDFDFERPALLLGLPADFAVGEIDALGSSTILSAGIERVYERGNRLEWFWTAGAGLNLLDVEPVAGVLEDGTPYRINTDSGDELIVSLSAGLRLKLAGRWAFEIAARADQHLADWKLVDEVSGATGVVDDYLVRGVTLGLRYRF